MVVLLTKVKLVYFRCISHYVKSPKFLHWCVLTKTAFLMPGYALLASAKAWLQCSGVRAKVQQKLV